MLNTIVTKIFGSRNERAVKRMGRQVQKINELEPQVQSLGDEELAARTDEFRRRFAGVGTLPYHSC